MEFKSESYVEFHSSEIIRVLKLDNIYMVERFDFKNMLKKDMYYGWVSVSIETFKLILSFFNIKCKENKRIYVNPK